MKHASVVELRGKRFARLSLVAPGKVAGRYLAPWLAHIANLPSGHRLGPLDVEVVRLTTRQSEAQASQVNGSASWLNPS